MLSRRIIACLDVRNGEVVKGVQFVDLREAGDPAVLARRHAHDGADEIVFLDITATSDSRNTLLDAVARTARELFIPFTVGGGVRTLHDAEAIFHAGADKVAINSAAVANPNLITDIAREFGSQAVVVAVDSRRTPAGDQVFTAGGRIPAELETIAWVREAESCGAGEILLTSMDADGTRSGFDCELTARAAEVVNIPVIASGGAGSPQHFVDVFTIGRADAALAASIFHFGITPIQKLKQTLNSFGIPVRFADSENGQPC